MIIIANIEYKYRYVRVYIELDANQEAIALDKYNLALNKTYSS